MHSVRRNLLLWGMAAFSMPLVSCAGVKPLTAEPPQDAAFRSELKKDVSSLNVTFEASARELSDYLNRVTPRELFRGSAHYDGLTTDITRNGPIIVGAADNYIYVTLPISMSLNYGAFESPAISARLKFKMRSTVTPDWKINSEIYYAGMSDLLSVEVGIGPFSFNPRRIVEGASETVQRTLSGLINRKINEKIQLRDQVAKAWNAAQKPILLDRNHSAWLDITPQEVLLYPFYAQNNQIMLSVGLKSFAELVVGPEPRGHSPVPLPNLKQGNSSDRAFRVAINTDLYYRDLLAIASPLLLNKELGSEGKSVILKGLDLYGNGEQLIVKVRTSGSLDGTFYLTCKPEFDPQTNQFSVEDVDFDMQTRSLLLNTADWFLHGTIRSVIREKLNMDLTQRLLQAREIAGKAMSKVKLADNVYLNGGVRAIKLKEVIVKKDRISIQVYGEGDTAILLH